MHVSYVYHRFHKVYKGTAELTKLEWFRVDHRGHGRRVNRWFEILEYGQSGRSQQRQRAHNDTNHRLLFWITRMGPRKHQHCARPKGRKGTLWEERFKIILVEGAGEALVTMAAYIDLNLVRAGLMDEPQDNRWCGYAEAMAGQKQAAEAFQFIARAMTGQEEKQTQALELYRRRLFGQGEERDGTDEAGQPLRRGFKRETVLQVIQAKGMVSPTEYVRCRVRYFADGAALGSRAFVEGVFAQFRDRFGPTRQSGARTMTGLASEGLFTLRKLRVASFS